jgi:ABC-type transport system involved in cytochrome c biogenesis ATPase subunit
LLRLILEQKKLWILDEPFNHLDDLSIEILSQTFLDHVNNDGMILFASHFNPIINNLETLQFN